MAVDGCANREILYCVQNDAQSVFVFNAVILSEAKDLKGCKAVDGCANREILHCVQNDI